MQLFNLNWLSVSLAVDFHVIKEIGSILSHTKRFSVVFACEVVSTDFKRRQTSGGEENKKKEIRDE